MSGFCPPVAKALYVWRCSARASCHKPLCVLLLLHILGALLRIIWFIRLRRLHGRLEGLYAAPSCVSSTLGTCLAYSECWHGAPAHARLMVADELVKVGFWHPFTEKPCPTDEAAMVEEQRASFMGKLVLSMVSARTSRSVFLLRSWPHRSLRMLLGDDHADRAIEALRRDTELFDNLKRLKDAGNSQAAQLVRRSVFATGPVIQLVASLRRSPEGPWKMHNELRHFLQRKERRIVGSLLCEDEFYVQHHQGPPEVHDAPESGWAAYPEAGARRSSLEGGGVPCDTCQMSDVSRSAVGAMPPCDCGRRSPQTVGAQNLCISRLSALSGPLASLGSSASSGFMNIVPAADVASYSLRLE